MDSQYDIVIVGGGLAGLTLARHLCLAGQRTVGNRRIALLERRPESPEQPKVGESTVQLAGYYFSRVLGLERMLMDDHYLKYNLRWYWPATGTDGSDFDHYSQSYLRAISNVCSYQIDRAKFETALWELLRNDPRVDILAPITDLEVQLAEGATPHRVGFGYQGSQRWLETRWLIDATGRRRLLQKQLGLSQTSPVEHGSSFLWVDGAVDIEQLTGRTRREVRLDPRRRQIGHMPLFLATNHFMGEGWWLWVIPLKGRTSIGLVFDRQVIDFSEVSSADRLLEWIDSNVPLLSEDLRSRELIGHSGFRSYAYGARLSLSPDRWAMTGESGRFSDPLYSPGSDLIALHNTMIVDAIDVEDRELSARCRRSETLLQALYESYLPSYSESYDALGDQETFSLKYSWELAIYFAFYVFPFINDLFTEPRFTVIFLRRFARLGSLNRALQRLLSDYFQWKKVEGLVGGPRVDFELSTIQPLAWAQETFYEVGCDPDAARRVLDEQLKNLEELANFFACHLASVVLDVPEATTDAGFVSAVDPEQMPIDRKHLQIRWEETRNGESYDWSFSITALDRLNPRLRRSRAVADEEVVR